MVDPAAAPANLDACNIVFDSLSKDEADSIPLGNGNTGINLWVEANGDLLFYLARNDALSEMHRLLKLGRVRVTLSPNPFVTGHPYRQVLRLREGRCEIMAGEPGSEVRLRVLVDSASQTIYVTGSSDHALGVTAKLENWRGARNDLTAQGSIGATWIYRNGLPQDEPAWESPDVFVDDARAVICYHANAHTPVPLHIKGQHLEQDAKLVSDPIKGRVFGSTLFGPGFVARDRITLALTAPAKTFDLRIATHSAQYPQAKGFLADLRLQAQQSVAPGQAATRTAAWWQAFWNRSWIFVEYPDNAFRIPANTLPLRFGAASDGSNALPGSFGRFTVFARALAADEIAQLAATTRDKASPVAGSVANSATGFAAKGDANLAAGTLAGGFLEAKNSAGLTFPLGITLEAWIQPASLGGRLFDKVNPGGTNGFLFDTYGGKLRWGVSNQIFYGSAALTAGQWVHVAAVADPRNGVLSIYQNGKSVGGSAPPMASAAPSRLTHAYVLTKYQFACQERSPLPAHFNGGIFTVAPEFAYYATDPRGRNWSADYRFYGPSYWWQNTRFMYQLHLAQGNEDLMDSFFDFYFRNMPVFQAKAKAYYKADGIFMNEVLSGFGLPGMGDFGWGAADYSEGYTRNIWQQCLEFGALALDRYDYTGDEAFLKKTLVWCDNALKFYDTRFNKDAQGRIVINPTHAVETYWEDVTNDMPSVAGLHEISTRLLEIPRQFTTPAQRADWLRIQAALPPIPKTRNKEGLVVPDNAEKYNPQRANYESPDLNCVYPFRIYGIGRGTHDIEEARRAWKDMPNPGHCCWYQTGIIAARLGLADGAAEDMLARSSVGTQLGIADSGGRNFRFPGFFASPHDWCPDYDGAGNMSNTLQEMLVQNGEHGELLLLPAWPENWDVNFKLHAARQTVVEGVFRNSKLVQLKVTPESRRKDVIFVGMTPDALPPARTAE